MASTSARLTALWASINASVASIAPDIAVLEGVACKGRWQAGVTFVYDADVRMSADRHMRFGGTV
jgi:hypothetical protein